MHAYFYSGWCYTARKNTTAGITGDILSYEVWVYICFCALTVLYLVLFICIRCNKVSLKSALSELIDCGILLM